MSLAHTTGIEIDQAAILRSLNLDPRNPKTQALVLTCERYGLDPILRHALLIEGNLYVTRDGLLHVAHQSGQLDGIEVVESGEDQHQWFARVSVYRKDMTRPFTYLGRYSKSGTNKKYGPEMAIKVAEVQALRRAFDIAIGTYEEQWDEQASAPLDGPLSPDRVQAFLDTCDGWGLDPADVVERATEGRTREVIEVTVAELDALRDAAKALRADQPDPPDPGGTSSAPPPAPATDVVADPTADVDAEASPASVPPEEADAVTPPAASAPPADDPDRVVTDVDILKLAGKVFAAARELVGRGNKSKIIDGCRHGLTLLLTDGRTASHKELSLDEKRSLWNTLRQLDERHLSWELEVDADQQPRALLVAHGDDVREIGFADIDAKAAA